MKLLLIILSVLCFSEDDFKLQNGDLIFQEDCTQITDNTIKEVTSSIEGYNFTHVGIVYIDETEDVFVLEATRPKVVLTPINEYLYPEGAACYPRSVVGRLEEGYQHLIPKAFDEGMKLIDKEYDDGFILGNDKYYCSELIYDILLKANNGIPVFPLNIMTFKSPDTGEITEEWKSYFEKYGLPIPEGEPGVNPGAMSRSSVIKIIYNYL